MGRALDRLARGERFSRVDVILLSFSAVATILLLLPVFVQLFHFDAMKSQRGEFVATECARLGENASFRCWGEFVPEGAESALVPAPHWFDDEGKILEPGESIPATLYQDGFLTEAGKLPAVHQIFLIAGGAFGVVGYPILAAYIIRAIRGRAVGPSDSPHGTNVLTGASIRPDGWDAEPADDRRSRLTSQGVILVGATVATLISLGVVLIDEVRLQSRPHAEGIVTIAECRVDPSIKLQGEGGLRCAGDFVPDDAAAAEQLITRSLFFAPRNHAGYAPDETVRVTVYANGVVRDPAPFSIGWHPGLIWATTFAATGLFALLVWGSPFRRRDARHA